LGAGQEIWRRRKKGLRAPPPRFVEPAVGPPARRQSRRVNIKHKASSIKTSITDQAAERRDRNEGRGGLKTG